MVWLLLACLSCLAACVKGQAGNPNSPFFTIVSGRSVDPRNGNPTLPAAGAANTRQSFQTTPGTRCYNAATSGNQALPFQYFRIYRDLPQTPGSPTALAPLLAFERQPADIIPTSPADPICTVTFYDGFCPQPTDGVGPSNPSVAANRPGAAPGSIDVVGFFSNFGPQPGNSLYGPLDHSSFEVACQPITGMDWGPSAPVSLAASIQQLAMTDTAGGEGTGGFSWTFNAPGAQYISYPPYQQNFLQHPDIHVTTVTPPGCFAGGSWKQALVGQATLWGWASAPLIPQSLCYLLILTLQHSAARVKDAGQQPLVPPPNVVGYKAFFFQAPDKIIGDVTNVGGVVSANLGEQCEASSGSPLQSDCFALADDLRTDGLPFIASLSRIQCTRVRRVGSCGVEVCDGNPGANLLGTTLFPGFANRGNLADIVRMLAHKCAVNDAPAGQFRWKSGGHVPAPGAPAVRNVEWVAELKNGRIVPFADSHNFERPNGDFKVQIVSTTGSEPWP